MAKRKAVKNKAIKKKAAKKAAKQATRAARKKKSARKTGQARKLVQIKFRCRQGLCTARPKFAHMSPGDDVDLIADGTNVTITFLTSSPFVSATNPIHITSGTTDHQQVSATAAGTYQYTLDCSAC